MFVNEIFYSISGEGRTSGSPAVFIRMQGCNLSCKWCDTKQANHIKKSQDMNLSITEIIKQVDSYKCNQVIITGGEPFVQHNALTELTRALAQRNYTVIIQTNGSYPIPAGIKRYTLFANKVCMDVKCPSSGMEQHNRLDNLDALSHTDEVKFVVADEADILFALTILTKYHTRATVIFQPVWGSTPEFLHTLAMHFIMVEHPHKNNWRISLQIHKYLGVA